MTEKAVLVGGERHAWGPTHSTSWATPVLAANTRPCSKSPLEPSTAAAASSCFCSAGTSSSSFPAAPKEVSSRRESYILWENKETTKPGVSTLHGQRNVKTEKTSDTSPLPNASLATSPTPFNVQESWILILPMCRWVQNIGDILGTTSSPHGRRAVYQETPPRPPCW